LFGELARELSGESGRELFEELAQVQVVVLVGELLGLVLVQDVVKDSVLGREFVVR
jgi:hypothetical protein